MSDSSFFDELERKLLALRPEQWIFQGATEKELVELESQAGISFPAAYREFLNRMRSNPKDPFVGQWNGIHLREQAETLIRKRGVSFGLSKSAFVFLFPHNEEFSFFDAEDGPNPPVFTFGERDKHPRRVADSFTEFLGSYVSEIERSVIFSEPDEILIQLHRNNADARKLRRFCCACVRRIWNQIADSPASCHAVEVAERFVEGKATPEELAEVRTAAKLVIDAVLEGPARNARRAADWSADADMHALGTCRSVGWAVAYASTEGQLAERTAQAEFLRKIFWEELT